MKKKICLTGIRCTGQIHLGNYLGAMRPALNLYQGNVYDCYFFLADYHALNSNFDAQKLKESIYEISATWLALGLDPEKSCFYRQSDISEVSEMAIILSNFTSKGLLNRAHSYKDAIGKNKTLGRDLDHGINAGLYLYPVLMTSDILTFNADVVPVGPDQAQHLEMSRDIAQCFNSNCNRDVLTLPTPLIKEESGLVKGLDGRKMSKSYGNTLGIFTPDKKLKKLINKIPTDSSGPSEPKDPKESLLFEYYSLFASDEKREALKVKYQKGVGWGEVKLLLFDEINNYFKDARLKYEKLLEKREYLDEVLAFGAKKAKIKARKTLLEVKKTLGLIA